MSEESGALHKSIKRLMANRLSRFENDFAGDARERHATQIAAEMVEIIDAAMVSHRRVLLERLRNDGHGWLTVEGTAEVDRLLDAGRDLAAVRVPPMGRTRVQDPDLQGLPEDAA